MSVKAVWNFIVGDSRLAPVAVVVAIVVAVVMLRAAMPSTGIAATFAGIIALGLAAAVFERT
jgi:hypothetical protein